MNHAAATLAQSHWIPVAIFLATYILIAVESGRGSHLDRTAAAFCGAVAMVLVGAVPLTEAYQTIDWNTLIFLLGIMILVAHFQTSGFFDWIAVHVAAVARTRFQLLVLLVFATGILAAFFVNDTICLIFTPIVLVVTQRLEVPPIPYLIAVATSANIGSVMSVTGNPQNAVIGVSAHFSFGISGASGSGIARGVGRQCGGAFCFLPPGDFSPPAETESAIAARETAAPVTDQMLRRGGAGDCAVDSRPLLSAGGDFGWRLHSDHRAREGAKHLSAAGLGAAFVFRVAICGDQGIRGVGRAGTPDRIFSGRTARRNDFAIIRSERRDADSVESGE